MSDEAEPTTAEEHLIALMWDRVGHAIVEGTAIDPFTLRWDLQHYDDCDCPDRLPYARDLLAAERAKVARIEALFSGGPDTSCRTTWQAVDVGPGPFERVMVECVEVPMDDLRAALAGPSPSDSADAVAERREQGRADAAAWLDETLAGIDREES